MSAAKEFEKSLLSKAKSLQKHIVLPEGSEERTLKASDVLLRDGIVKLTLIGNEKEIKKFIDYIYALTWTPSWCIVFKKSVPDVWLMEYHTGGWSGNEQIVGAMQKTYFWVFYWQLSRRGGHYWFEIKFIKENKK